jgi:hypothetical protein
MEMFGRINYFSIIIQFSIKKVIQSIKMVPSGTNIGKEQLSL